MAANVIQRTMCAWFGHSRIIEGCLGYVHCARCNEQIGDTLGGAFDGRNYVIVGHDCETCREVAKTLAWRDRLFAPNPRVRREGGQGI